MIGVSIVVDKAASATISGITFRGSKAKGQSSLIHNQGNLTLETCSISGNSVSGFGGGIYNGGTFTLTNSLVSDNTASGSDAGAGGGIYNDGTFTLTNSPVSDNSVSGYGVSYGGGIFNNRKVTLTNSPVSGNSVSGYGYGGGIFNHGTFTLTNSPVSDNTASGSGGGSGAGGSGGGIFNDNSGTLTLTNSLVSDNTASGYGGGIYNYNDSSHQSTHVTLVFCTFVNNSAIDRHGFNIDDEGDPKYSQMYLKASIIGGNGTQDTRIAGGAITSGGYNIIQLMSSGTFVNNTAHSTDRSVDDLSHVFRPFPVAPNKDDPDQTYQLIPGTNNPAFDAVPSTACTDAAGHRVLTDQRGMPRPGKMKRNCDSGAYEYQMSP